MRYFALFFLTAALLRATTYVSDGSQADVQSKINGASPGDAVTIPAGAFAWASAVTCNKGITISGAGAGRVVARSATSLAIGTGTKVFTLTTETIASIEALKSAIVGGSSLRIYRTGGIVSGGTPTGVVGWMDGTVTSLVGATLTMNITTTNGSATQGSWIVVTPATTSITHNAGAARLLQLTENTSSSTVLYGIRFLEGTGTGDHVEMISAASGMPILIHDLYFESSVTVSDSIQTNTNQGVIWNCSFVALPFSIQQLAIHLQGGPTNSWTTTSTMGTADTTGRNNLYIEDCDLHGWLNATDFDENARVSIRYCLWDNAAFGSHGADSSNYGMRHFEVYNSVFFRNDFSNGETLNVNWWFLIRGGTGVVTGNVIPRFGGTDYAGAAAFRFAVWNLGYNGGPNGGWGVIATSGRAAGWNYPSPRQFGMGNVTGAAVLPAWLSGGPYPGPGATWSGNLATFGGVTYKSTAANSSTSNPSVNTGQWTNTGYAAGRDSITYIGDSEPFYAWNNTPTGGSAATVLASDYGANNPSSVSTTAVPVTTDTAAAYVVADRDYFYDTTGTSTGAKPGWTAYTYPQPLRTGVSSGGSVVGGNSVLVGNLKLQ